MVVEGRELGRTGIVIPPVIMGCGNFGGVGSAPAFFGMGESVSEAMVLLDRALELGLTVLDTADAYGGGRSEETIGAWLAARGAATRDRDVRSGAWNVARREPMFRIAGKTLGICGYGRIGQAFHRKAAGLGFARTLIHDPYLSQPPAGTETRSR